MSNEGTETQELQEKLGTSFAIQPEDALYDPMMDKARRARVEACLEPMSFEDMVFQGYTTQEVKISEKLTVTFRSLLTQHGMWLEWRLRDLGMESPAYVRHYFSLMQVAACVEEISGKPIGPEVVQFTKDSQREEFFAALDARLEWLQTRPSVFTDDLIVQYAWFGGRLRKLVTHAMENVGKS